MNRALLIVSAIPWLLALALFVIGLAVGASAESGDFVSAYFGTGDFVTAAFGAGQFVAGAFAAGLFGGGVRGCRRVRCRRIRDRDLRLRRLRGGRVRRRGQRHRCIRHRAERDRSIRHGQERGVDTGPLGDLTTRALSPVWRSMARVRRRRMHFQRPTLWPLMAPRGY
jgi:hypothetical protein